MKWLRKATGYGTEITWMYPGDSSVGIDGGEIHLYLDFEISRETMDWLTNDVMKDLADDSRTRVISFKNLDDKKTKNYNEGDID